MASYCLALLIPHPLHLLKLGLMDILSGMQSEDSISIVDI